MAGRIAVAFACCIALGACAAQPKQPKATEENLDRMLDNDAPPPPEESKPKERVIQAKALLEGPEVTGRAVFRQEGDAVFVQVRVEGLKPGQMVGLQIHSGGICGESGQLAGDFFNPTDKPIGDAYDIEHHAGALEGLVADGAGVAEMEMRSKHFTVDSGDTAIAGRTLVVHEDADPVNNPEGQRISCGLIRR